MKVAIVRYAGIKASLDIRRAVPLFVLDIRTNKDKGLALALSQSEATERTKEHNRATQSLEMVQVRITDMGISVISGGCRGGRLAVVGTRWKKCRIIFGGLKIICIFAIGYY